MRTDQHHSVRRLGPAHWLIVRRTFGGWLVEEHLAGQIEALMEKPDLRRDVVELLADAYQATRNDDKTREEF